MAFIDWSVQFSVGSPVLDQQHKSLIALINQLHAAMLRGALKDDIRRIFSELVTYTETHFKAEEQMMQQAGYPRLLPHQQQHREFVAKARDLQHQLAAGKYTVSMDLLKFLKTWLSEHILGTDQQYAPFLSSAKHSVAGRA